MSCATPNIGKNFYVVVWIILTQLSGFGGTGQAYFIFLDRNNFSMPVEEALICCG